MIYALGLSLLGAAAVMIVTYAVWSPLHARELTLRRRIEWFIDGVGRRPELVAVDQTAKLRRKTVRPLKDRGPIMRMVELQLTKAQVDAAPERLLLAVFALAPVAGAIGFFVDGTTGALLGGAAVPAVTWMWLGRKAAAIQTKFADQLAETVSLLSSSVRAGQSVQQALEHVSTETLEPTRSAFALVVREVGLGASVEEALIRLYERFPSEDMELMTTVISIQSSVGGSLAKILDTVGTTIRERRQMKAEVHALTSQQRYSAYVLALMPVFLLIAMKLISPDYMDELFKESMRFVLFIAAGLVTTGFLVMRKMADIDA